MTSLDARIAYPLGAPSRLEARLATPALDLAAQVALRAHSGPGVPQLYYPVDQSKVARALVSRAVGQTGRRGAASSRPEVRLAEGRAWLAAAASVLTLEGLEAFYTFVGWPA